MGRLFEIKNLHVTLGDKILFDSLSFVFNEGDCFMLTGENGTGKSLLLELIALGETPNLHKRYQKLKITGEILDSNGKNLLNSETYRKIAYVAQVEEPHKNATLLNEAENSTNGVGIDLDEKKLDYLLEKFKLLDKKRKKLKNNLSLGEGKLVHIITRILKLPATNILLLDEPLNHLSFKNSKILNEVIREERKNNPNLSILVVSHCCAITFVDKRIEYNHVTKHMDEKEYHSYDCFS